MNKQIAIATAILIFAAVLIGPLTAMAQSQGPMLSMFCSAVRAGVAQGPQSSSCGLLGNGLNNNQLNQQNGINQNPCPSGQQLVGLQCQVINGLLNNAANNAAQQQVLCNVQNAVITPAVANAGAAQTVSQGSVVTLSGSGSTASTVSTGFGTAATCSQVVGTISTYTWTQTSGTQVSLTGSTTATPTFTAPATSTTLVFSLVVTDSNSQTSQPATVTISVS
jgi:hypothetical protein